MKLEDVKPKREAVKSDVEDEGLGSESEVEEDLEDFDPLGVPTVLQLVQEIDAWRDGSDGEGNEGESEGCHGVACGTRRTIRQKGREGKGERSEGSRDGPRI